MTAPCPTRCVYRYPPLANQIWKRWRDTQTEKRYYAKLPVNIPKDWQKRQVIRDCIILACPFCSQSNSINNKKGNLEHVHVYCQCKPLVNIRLFCNQKIEETLYKLYDYASLREYNCPFRDSTRMTTLQENLINAAKKAELAERKIIKDSKVISESRQKNIAIKSRIDIQQDVLLHRLPPKKINEYDTFPLTSELGFLHAIPENELNMATATVIDVVFLGFFPKPVYLALQAYAREMERQKESNAEFKTLSEWLVVTIIYRSITTQKIVQLLLSGFKKYLDNLDQHRESEGMNELENVSLPSDSASTQTATPVPKIPQKVSHKKCYATKCQILRAKGILCGYKMCSGKRNACSGCSNEASKQRLVLALETEILHLSCDNTQLAPLLVCRTQPITLKAFRKVMLCLPSLAKTSRNDSKFGASIYFANTLGILLQPTDSSRIMDEPLSTKHVNNLWRQALLFCRCVATSQDRRSFGSRAFCTHCQYLIKIPEASECQGCNTYKSWLSKDAPCLSCQFAAIAFRNPFQSRLSRLIDDWLPLPSDSEDSSRGTLPKARPVENNTPGPIPPTTLPEGDLVALRTMSYCSSFSEIRSRSTPEQNQCVIENITLLQQDFKQTHSTKRDLTSAHSGSQCSDSIVDENLSPRKKHLIQRRLFKNELSSSYDMNSRAPLEPIDTNVYDTDMSSTSWKTRWKHGSGKQIKRNERTMRAKERKQEKLILKQS